MLMVNVNQPPRPNNVQYLVARAIPDRIEGVLMCYNSGVQGSFIAVQQWCESIHISTFDASINCSLVLLASVPQYSHTYTHSPTHSTLSYPGLRRRMRSGVETAAQSAAWSTVQASRILTPKIDVHTMTTCTTRQRSGPARGKYRIPGG